MLAEFILANRDAVIALTSTRISARSDARPALAAAALGIPMFLDQLAEALRVARSSDIVDHVDMARTAGEHGHYLLKLGLTVGQVVHDYGAVCQAVTELAVEQGVPIGATEFRTMNLCLDDAIAGAVTEYSRQRERVLADEGTERLGVLAHEFRNLLNTAMLSFEVIRRGQVAPGGSTSLVLGRSLLGLRSLVDRSLAVVRLDIGIDRVALVSVAELLEEVEVGASMQAKTRAIVFDVGPVDHTLTVEGDRQILAAAIANLLQNAFKFTPLGGRVQLTVAATLDRVQIEVEDSCGGLPPGQAEELFLPFSQRSADRSGLGLGLSISMKAAKASGGDLRVRDLPGKGCIFTIELPRKPPPPLAVIDGGKGRRPAVGEGTGGVNAVPALGVS